MLWTRSDRANCLQAAERCKTGGFQIKNRSSTKYKFPLLRATFRVLDQNQNVIRKQHLIDKYHRPQKAAHQMMAFLKASNLAAQRLQSGKKPRRLAPRVECRRPVRRQKALCRCERAKTSAARTRRRSTQHARARRPTSKCPSRG